MNDIHVISDTTETITNKTSVCSKLYVRSMCATAYTQCLFTTVVLLYTLYHIRHLFSTGLGTSAPWPGLA